MKKLHLFILKSYLGPLVMTFLIALFILLMQFLWMHIDKLVGKGLEIGVLIQLLFFASLQLIPMALPLAILLASLMTFGSLGENYELTALKSAGISLPRIMLPLIILTGIMSATAFKFSNNVLPYANLKLYSLLYDVKNARPELEIKEKVFYSGIDGFTIKIDKKEPKKDILYKLMIYDHRLNKQSNTNVTIADSGRIKIASDNSFAMLTLYNGAAYNEKVLDSGKKSSKKRDQQFREDRFREETAFIPLKGFDFTRTDEELFKHNDRMKNIEQLERDRDSITNVRDNQIKEFKTRTSDFYFSNCLYTPKYVDKVSTEELNKTFNASKSLDIDSIFSKESKRDKIAIVEKALVSARNNKQQVDNQITPFTSEAKKIISHKMEWHRKFTLSLACIIFFFIGAPLGAIIRKGGLGMPTVISILFFIIYFVIDTVGLKMAKEGIWEVYQGLWLSSAVLFPIGAFLTYKSTTDSTLFNADVYYHNMMQIKEKAQTIFKSIGLTKKQS